jgi:hypothetical protein
MPRQVYFFASKADLVPVLEAVEAERERSYDVHARQIAGARYSFDQLTNPGTITFAPGGLWGEEVLLHGRCLAGLPRPRLDGF